MLVSLILLPGTGQRDVQLPEGASLATLAEQEGLGSRQLILNGQSIPRSQWGETVLASGVEIGAITGTKGN